MRGGVHRVRLSGMRSGRSVIIKGGGCVNVLIGCLCDKIEFQRVG